MYEWKPYAESTPSDCEPSVSGRAVFGPPILSVAWIPYYANIDEIRLPTAVSNPRWKDAFQLMLRSGNSAPPFRFEGKSDVRGFLAVKNFRAALGLCDVKLETDRAGLAVRISFSFLQEVGCTAVRMNENPAVLRYVRGKAVTAEHPRIVWNREENLVEIVHEIKFRLSGLLAFAAKWKVGEWPAYA